MLLLIMLAATETEVHQFYPLNEFYSKLGLRVPHSVSVDGEQVPEPYRSLLVHQNDMTPTLENAYGATIELKVMEYAVTDDVLSRQILLFPQGRGKPVLFGSIKIYLDRFPEPARTLVLEQKLPLGAILRSQGIVHFSRPSAFFRVKSDSLINEALQLSSEVELFGRQNVLRDSEMRTLAQVLEILPPHEV